MSKKRPVIAVVTTQVSDSEQKRYLHGIISEAMALGYDTFIISNIYNPSDINPVLFSENKIYDYIDSPDIDAFILISESFINAELKQIIIEKLMRHRNKPIIAVGGLQEDFIMPEFIHVDSDDADDFEVITSHLIEIHGFTDIDIITGHDTIDVSYFRVDGYRRALEKHNLPYNERKVFFGDFWTTSGVALAQRYIKKEIPLPQALICANDYMAYGVLDEFLKNNIKVPENITVVGFENVGNRLIHAPVLTTFRRNRQDVGRKAVREVHCRLCGKKEMPSFSLRGKFISGNSCPCGLSVRDQIEELDMAQNEQTFYFLNLFSHMEQSLTECTSIREFIGILGEFTFMNRNTNEIYICLPERWYDENSESEILNCYKVRERDCDDGKIIIKKLDISGILSESDTPSAYYINPLFFSERILGYTVLRYDTNDSFDPIFRNWLKSVANALEFLRMKNDIRYLIQCRNLSEKYDTLTGLLNRKGFIDMLELFSLSATENTDILITVLDTQLISSGFQTEHQDIRMTIANEIADTLRKMFGTSKAVCGRLSGNTFACAVMGHFSDNLKEMVSSKLFALVIYETAYAEELGMESMSCTSEIIKLSESFSAEKTIQNITDSLSNNRILLVHRKKLSQYKELTELRNSLYLNPKKKQDIERFCMKMNISVAHFRHLYTNTFGISYNQDCIRARMILAEYYLCTSSLDINNIAMKCGYENTKYFLRLFHKNISLTPTQYREKMFFTE